MYKTLLGTKIELGESIDSSITYKVSMKNNSNLKYYYKETVHDDAYYDNNDVTYEISELNYADIVQPGEEISFYLTFKYNSDITNIDKTILNSVLEFIFLSENEANRVILAYNGVETPKILLKSETKGSFETVTVNSGVVIRGNNGAVPIYSDNKVSFENVTKDCTLKVFDNSLKEAMDSSDTSVNNYLWIANENPTASIEFPSNKTANVNFNGKNINFVAGSNVSYINNSGNLSIEDKTGTGKFIAEYSLFNNNTGGNLTIKSGTYLGTSSAGTTPTTGCGVIKCTGGFVSINNSNITAISEYAVNAIGINESVIHIDNSNLKSDQNAVSNAGQNGVVSIANSTIASGPSDAAILSGSRNSSYICNSKILSGDCDFYAYSSATISATSRLYYTPNVTFKNGGNTPYFLNGYDDNTLLAIKNYKQATNVDWYQVKDSKGNPVKLFDGKNIKVGDKLKIVTRLNSNMNIDFESAKFADNTNLYIYSNNDTIAQHFNFLASNQEGCYNIVPYGGTKFYFNVDNVENKVGANIFIKTGSDTENERFRIVDSNMVGYYYIDTIFGTTLDVNNSDTANQTNVQSYTPNRTDNQLWKFEKVDVWEYEEATT